METQLNVSLITLAGLVEVEKYRHVYFVLLFLVFVLITCSNSVVVHLICIQPRLHEPMYVLIAALLLNSVLLSSAVYPKLLADVWSERQRISYPACLIQFQVFYSFGGSEFLLLAAMSYDRYVSICSPLRYPAIMNKTTVCVLLVCAWILPFSQVAAVAGLRANKQLCSFTLKSIFCNNTLYRLQCEESRADKVLDVMILLNVALVPVLFILFTYSRILVVVCGRGRAVRRKAARTCLPHLIVLVNFSSLCVYDVITAQLDLDFQRPVRLVMSLQIVMYHPLLNPVMYGLQMRGIKRFLTQ